ncbi:hypothetical protein OKW43_003885 [Paraburkholderia sp. WC7.3g]
MAVGSGALKIPTASGWSTQQRHAAARPARHNQGRTTWKPNLPAARANGFSNCR